LIHGSTRLNNGKIEVKNTNTSNNKSFHYSSIILYPIINGNEEHSDNDALYKQCIIVSNYAHEGICIGFFGNFHHCTECSIINNHQATSKYGVLWANVYANALVDKCVIIDNIDYSDRHLFDKGYSSYFVVENCTIDDFGLTSETIDTNNISITDNVKYLVLQINFVPEFDCKIQREFLSCKKSKFFTSALSEFLYE
jgi:hypothetical protein